MAAGAIFQPGWGPQIRPHSLRGRLMVERDKREAEIANGLVADWPDYMKRVGFIAGLNEAIAMCEQAEKEND